MFALAHKLYGALNFKHYLKFQVLKGTGLIDMYGGGFAAQANAIRVGFEVALAEANARGGVQGRKLVLTTADMGISVEKGITEAR